jgi:hypothetical protein
MDHRRVAGVCAHKPLGNLACLLQQGVVGLFSRRLSQAPVEMQLRFNWD